MMKAISHDSRSTTAESQHSSASNSVPFAVLGVGLGHLKPDPPAETRYSSACERLSLDSKAPNNANGELSTGSRTLPNDSGDSGLAVIAEPAFGSRRTKGLVPENPITASVTGPGSGLGSGLGFDPEPANEYSEIDGRDVGAGGNKAPATVHRTTMMDSSVVLPLPAAASDLPFLGQQLESGSYVDINGTGTGDDIVVPTEGATHHDRSTTLPSFQAQHENELDSDSETEYEMGDEVNMHMGTARGMKSGDIVGGKCCRPNSESGHPFSPQRPTVNLPSNAQATAPSLQADSTYTIRSDRSSSFLPWVASQARGSSTSPLDPTGTMRNDQSGSRTSSTSSSSSSTGSFNASLSSWAAVARPIRSAPYQASISFARHRVKRPPPRLSSSSPFNTPSKESSKSKNGDGSVEEEKNASSSSHYKPSEFVRTIPEPTITTKRKALPHIVPTLNLGLETRVEIVSDSESVSVAAVRSCRSGSAGTVAKGNETPSGTSLALSSAAVTTLLSTEGIDQTASDVIADKTTVSTTHEAVVTAAVVGVDATKIATLERRDDTDEMLVDEEREDEIRSGDRDRLRVDLLDTPRDSVDTSEPIRCVEVDFTRGRESDSSMRIAARDPMRTVSEKSIDILQGDPEIMDVINERDTGATLRNGTAVNISRDGIAREKDGGDQMLSKGVNIDEGREKQIHCDDHGSDEPTVTETSKPVDSTAGNGQDDTHKSPQLIDTEPMLSNDNGKKRKRLRADVLESDSGSGKRRRGNSIASGTHHADTGGIVTSLGNDVSVEGVDTTPIVQTRAEAQADDQIISLDVNNRRNDITAAKRRPNSQKTGLIASGVFSGTSAIDPVLLELPSRDSDVRLANREETFQLGSPQMSALNHEHSAIDDDAMNPHRDVEANRSRATSREIGGHAGQVQDQGTDSAALADLHAPAPKTDPPVDLYVNHASKNKRRPLDTLEKERQDYLASLALYWPRSEVAKGFDRVVGLVGKRVEDLKGNVLKQLARLAKESTESVAQIRTGTSLVAEGLVTEADRQLGYERCERLLRDQWRRFYKERPSGNKDAVKRRTKKYLGVRDLQDVFLREFKPMRDTEGSGGGESTADAVVEEDEPSPPMSLPRMLLFGDTTRTAALSASDPIIHRIASVWKAVVEHEIEGQGNCLIFSRSGSLRRQAMEARSTWAIEAQMATPFKLWNGIESGRIIGARDSTSIRRADEPVYLVFAGLGPFVVCKVSRASSRVGDTKLIFPLKLVNV